MSKFFMNQFVADRNRELGFLIRGRLENSEVRFDSTGFVRWFRNIIRRSCGLNLVDFSGDIYLDNIRKLDRESILRSLGDV